jgi:hypothetical protein
MVSEGFGYAALLGLGETPATAVMHPAQMFSLTMRIELIVIKEISTTQDIELLTRVNRLLEGYKPKKFMGCDIVEDSEMPKDEIAFCSKSGEVISRITQLAIPSTFFHE